MRTSDTIDSFDDPPLGATAERLAARGCLASAARDATIDVLASESFDILIIGGGISGAGVAREAALAGYRTALIERHDFASGTSSRSSRLVHGGVRYLEHGHISLVFEASRERRLLLKLAPHLVRPLAFTWPVYKGARVPRWKVRAGLLLYDALSMFRNVHPHEALSKSDVLAVEPALNPDMLHGGARYWDASTDDSRLTLAAALAARDAGAAVINYVEAISGVHSSNGRLTAVRVKDCETNSQFVISAHIVINTTGPWSDSTAAALGGIPQKQILGSAGAHIAVPRNRIGNHEAITIVSPLDGRVMFVLPSGPHSIVGTTERKVNESPDEVRATSQEITYLLRNVNVLFPHAQLSRDDVISAWAGIRPLAVARAGHSAANAASREHAVTRRDDGLVSLTGGKLTTFRSMAADVLKHALDTSQHSDFRLHRDGVQRTNASATTPLPGGDFTSLEHVEREAGETAHDAAVGHRLAHAYGSNWRNVWSYAQRDPSLRKRIVDDLPYVAAEVAHAVEREMACELADVLIRRTHIAFETRDHGRSAAKRIAPAMAALLGWSNERTQQAIDNYEREVGRIFNVEGE